MEALEQEKVLYFDDMTVVSVVDFINTYNKGPIARKPDYGLAYLDEFGYTHSIGDIFLACWDGTRACPK